MKQELRDEFWSSFAKSPFIMMKLDNAAGHAEPLTAQLDRDAHHAIWFYTLRSNRIASGGAAMGQFTSKGHDLFACIAGIISEEKDQTIFDKLWSRQVESWFPKGREDPDVLMLRFDIADAEVWAADLGIIGKVKLLTGFKISADEAGQHAVGLV